MLCSLHCSGIPQNVDRTHAHPAPDVYPVLRSLHWSDLHQMLLKGLPDGIVHFSHTVTSLEQPESSQNVIVRADRRKGKESEETEHIQLECDLLVAADGSMSTTRQRFFRPDESRRFANQSV